MTHSGSVNGTTARPRRPVALRGLRTRAPLLGAISDRIGRRPVLIISMVSTADGWFVFAGRSIKNAHFRFQQPATAAHLDFHLFHRLFSNFKQFNRRL